MPSQLLSPTAIGIVWLALAGTVCADPATPQVSTSQPPKQSISRDTFLKRVRLGLPIEDHTIPTGFLAEAMTRATEPWMKVNPGARIDIRRSSIVGSLLQPHDRLPTIPVRTLPPEVLAGAPSLSGSMPAVLLPVQLFHSVVSARFSFPNTYFAQEIELQQVVFEQDVDFAGSVFAQTFHVKAVKFSSLFVFASARPARGAGFSDVSFGGHADFSRLRARANTGVSFVGSTFAEDFELVSASIDGTVRFDRVKFTKRAFFNNINASSQTPVGRAAFLDVTFDGRAYFDQSRLAAVTFCEPRAHRLTQFHARVTFSGAHLGDACFGDVEFHAASSFATRFLGDVSFENVHFAEDASFVGASFERSNSVTLSGWSADKQIRIRWAQLAGRLAEPAGESRERELVFLVLLDAFRRASDLDSENECFYAWRRTFHHNPVSHALWGYGVRPLRALLAMVGLFGVFWALNWFLLAGRLEPGRSRAWMAASVALHTSYPLTPPLQLAQGEWWQTLFVIEWLLMKALQVTFVVAASNTSPVLKELMPRVLQW